MKLEQLMNNIAEIQKIRLVHRGKTLYEGMCGDCKGYDRMTVGLIEADHRNPECIRINVYQRATYKQ